MEFNFRVRNEKMETRALLKFCPVCKMANVVNASACQYCNAPLNSEFAKEPTTRRVEKPIELTEELKEKIARVYPPPLSGLLLFLLNRSEPVGLCTQQEFVLGRGGAPVSKSTFDLSEFEAYAMGVSREHAMIKEVEGRYMLTDLNSANGTWINGERIAPAKPHDLPSGSVIQLGRLKLVVLYSCPTAPEKK
jgi:hypothetical protein